ncbi:MAG: hypothetical protein LBG12_13440 [Synergistaceae bacterium]|nr:hypothetical protein [Synergistaceae bacterium]
MSVIIEESGISFGEYDDADVFYVEKSALYRNLGGGVRTVEFILKKDEKTLLWVEAKSSSPNPQNAKSVSDFENFLSELCEKFEHSLSLYTSAILKRIADSNDEIPNQMREMDYSRASFKMILVIRGHKESWLQPISDGFKRKMRACIKIWNIDPTRDVAVINEEGAKKYKLTIAKARED